MNRVGQKDGQQKRRILVVTDTPEDMARLEDQLDPSAYALFQSWGLEEALQKVHSASPDLILLDMSAPGTDGVEFCKRLRSQPETEAIPIIAIADEGGAAQEEALALGADGFICRPFQTVELVSRVRSLLRMKDLLDKVADQNRQLLEVNARLDRLNKELLARNRELEQGMDMARRLQEALLPQHYPKVKNVAFSHKYGPAQAIGGDVFHIAGLPGERAAIFVADVSGHGVRAALVSSIVKTVIDYIDMRDKVPTDVLKDFNSRFRGVLGPLTPQIYATGVILIVNGEQRTVAAASAGHPAPLVISKSSMTARPLMDLDSVGPALGFLSDPAYVTTECQLSVGDIVLAFTDGVYEVLNEQGEMYGLNRLQKLVADNAHLIPRDLIQKIITDTEAFMGTPMRPDDICIVAVEVQ